MFTIIYDKEKHQIFLFKKVEPANVWKKLKLLIHFQNTQLFAAALHLNICL